MSDQSVSQSKADAVYGDGGLPGDADLFVPCADAASTGPAAPEFPHSESTNTEEQ